MKHINKLIIKACKGISSNAEQVYMGFVDIEEGIYKVRLQFMKCGHYMDTVSMKSNTEEAVQKFIDETVQRFPPAVDIPIFWMDYGEM